MSSIKANNYRMKGLGSLLTMYGGAADTLEEQYAEYKKQFLNLKDKYFNTNTKAERKKIIKNMIHFKNLIDETKEKMDALVKSVGSISKDINLHKQVHKKVKKYTGGSLPGTKNNVSKPVYTNIEYIPPLYNNDDDYDTNEEDDTNEDDTDEDDTEQFYIQPKKHILTRESLYE